MIRVSDLRTKSEKNRFVRTRFPERDTSFSAPKTYTSKRKRRLQNTFLLLLLVFSSSSRERKRARVCVCLCIYNVLLLLKKRVEMREIRMCVVFCLQMKKKSLDFLFGGHFKKKKNERKDERKERSFLREISSVLLLSLVALLINSLERTKAREIREEL